MVLDKLTYAGNRGEPGARRATTRAGRPAAVRPGRHRRPGRRRRRSSRDADAVVNFAAESHVDRSILDPEAFLRTGVIGVHVLLEACRAPRGAAERFLQVSTDEVYGSVEDGHSREDDALRAALAVRRGQGRR